MKEKLSLLILFGGASSEHEVSRVSASSVLEHIDDEKYHINTIGITKEGNWFLTSSPAVRICDGSWEKDESNKKAVILPDRDEGGVLIREKDGRFSRLPVDVVFPVLHGKNGEDGTMQGLLQIAGLPFVGAGTTASAASMDKAITKAVVEQACNVNQAKCYVAHKKAFEKDPGRESDAIVEFFEEEFPLFVKPANAGSSVGITKVKAEEALEEALKVAFAEDSKVVVEEAIVGRELEVAVLGNEQPKASCIGEIFPANEFYDYNAKYENQGSKTAVVTDLDPEKEQEIRNTALRVYEVMGCRGLARVDFFLKESGKVIFNEINTLPGFTQISMYPKLWEASGLPYSQLIDELIRLALEGENK
ncbi:MAG: D-alanine--D-alanine ligase family protein [Bacillota bacterium]|nr:D-alanine--D-alanine ligase family protein [Bacillota bacterium]